MISVDDKIIFIYNTNQYSASILGVDRDECWILVPDLKSVFQDNPANIKTKDDGVTFAYSWDRKFSFDEIVNGFPEGSLRAPIFYGLDEKKKRQMANKVKMYDLLLRMVPSKLNPL